MATILYLYLHETKVECMLRAGLERKKTLNRKSFRARTWCAGMCVLFPCFPNKFKVNVWKSNLLITRYYSRQKDVRGAFERMSGVASPIFWRGENVWF